MTREEWITVEDCLTLHEHREGDVSIVHPVGEVDMATMRPLREMVRRLPDEGVRFLVFDLRDVSFLDSAGMSVLFGAKKRLDEEHGECYVVTTEDGFVAKTLHTISIETVMPHLHDPEEAKADIEQHRQARAARTAGPIEAVESPFQAPATNYSIRDAA